MNNLLTLNSLNYSVRANSVSPNNALSGVLVLPDIDITTTSAMIGSFTSTLATPGTIGFTTNTSTQLSTVNTNITLSLTVSGANSAYYRKSSSSLPPTDLQTNDNLWTQIPLGVTYVDLEDGEYIGFGFYYLFSPGSIAVRNHSSGVSTTGTINVV
jgi:hypothetical protein